MKKLPIALLAVSIFLLLAFGMAQIKESKRGMETFADTEIASRGHELFVAKTCDSCHMINGQGGASAQDLSGIGAHRDQQWLAGWLKNPAEVKPGTTMPKILMSEKEIKLLSAYLAGLRGIGGTKLAFFIPLLPGDSQVERGEKLYLMHCAGCHGTQGQGRQQGNAPALKNHALLKVADSNYLRVTISVGRPGTAMRPFAMEAGGMLTGEDIQDLVAFLEAWPEIERTPPDRELALRGAGTYMIACAKCHGKEGEGLVGPSLNNPVFLKLVDDRFLAETIDLGRPGTPMPGFAAGGRAELELSEQQIAELIALFRSWEDNEDSWNQETAEYVRLFLELNKKP